VIAEARRQAPQLPLLGESALVAASALGAAGAAAEGVRAHVPLSPAPDAGLAAGFVARYSAADKQPPDELALAGYLAVGMVKAGLEKAAMPDPRALADALRVLSATAVRQPMLLADCAWNAAGDPDRASFVVEVRGGTCRGIKTLRDPG
jgi:branched-chain amino acid transport system substrate-binding protein